VVPRTDLTWPGVFSHVPGRLCKKVIPSPSFYFPSPIMGLETLLPPPPLPIWGGKLQSIPVQWKILQRYFFFRWFSPHSRALRSVNFFCCLLLTRSLCCPLLVFYFNQYGTVRYPFSCCKLCTSPKAILSSPVLHLVSVPPHSWFFAVFMYFSIFKSTASAGTPFMPGRGGGTRPHFPL
jgi:hypothetical protein